MEKENIKRTGGEMNIKEIKKEMRKKVYILQKGTYEDKHIVGVFSSKELAEKYIKKRIFGGLPSGIEINEYQIDSLIRPDGKVVYSVVITFYENGEIISMVSWLYSLGEYEKEKEFEKNIISVKEKENVAYSSHTSGSYRGKARKFYGKIIAFNRKEAVRIVMNYAKKFNKQHPLSWRLKEGK